MKDLLSGSIHPSQNPARLLAPKSLPAISLVAIRVGMVTRTRN